MFLWVFLGFSHFPMGFPRVFPFFYGISYDFPIFQWLSRGFSHHHFQMIWRHTTTWERQLHFRSSNAKTLWRRCSLWVTHPDLEWGEHEFCEWRFSSWTTFNYCIYTFTHIRLLQNATWTNLFNDRKNYSIHVVRGDGPVAIWTNVPHFLHCSVDQLIPSP